MVDIGTNYTENPIAVQHSVCFIDRITLCQIKEHYINETTHLKICSGFRWCVLYSRANEGKCLENLTCGVKDRSTSHIRCCCLRRINRDICGLTTRTETHWTAALKINRKIWSQTHKNQDCSFTNAHSTSIQSHVQQHTEQSTHSSLNANIKHCRWHKTDSATRWPSWQFSWSVYPIIFQDQTPIYLNEDRSL